MVERKVLDISPAIVDISGVTESEVAQVFFDKETDWEGTYSLSIFDNETKSTEIELDDALNVATTRITWTISPDTQEVPTGLSYYEIKQVETKRIMFKGNLKISK